MNDISIFVILILSIITIISVRYTLNLRKYLKEFMSVSKEISNKNFEARVRTRMSGEMGEFANNFNSMIDTIKFTIEDTTNKNVQLKSIMQSVSHGILAIDTKGKILLINDVAKKMVDADENLVAEGSSIKQFIKNKLVLDSILYNVSGKNSVVIQKDIAEELVYKIKIDPVYFKDFDAVTGFIINIENITQNVKLENMRKQFVANVSHELKTPLTLIKGFIETLMITEDLNVDTKNRFLTIMDNETTRLTRLIDDILLLSTVENKTKKKVEKVNLFEVFKEVYEISNHIAEKKNIKIDYEFENEDVSIMAYCGYVRQILQNIIENAIKYTGEDGYVEIKEYIRNNTIFIEVKDNGIGIPKEDIDRIFERFYRVDKARSRSVGGTGLGLAITKHMVISLNGDVKVESELGVGSKFTIELPLNQEFDQNLK